MYIKISLFQLLLKIGIYNYVIRKIYTTFFTNSQFFAKLVFLISRVDWDYNIVAGGENASKKIVTICLIINYKYENKR